MTRPPFALDVELPMLAGDAVVELRANGGRDREPRVVERREAGFIDAGWPVELRYEHVVVDGVAIESRLAICVDLAGWPYDVVLRAGDDATRDAAAPAVRAAVQHARVREVVPACASDLLKWYGEGEAP